MELRRLSLLERDPFYEGRGPHPLRNYRALNPHMHRTRSPQEDPCLSPWDHSLSQQELRMYNRALLSPPVSPSRVNALQTAADIAWTNSGPTRSKKWSTRSPRRSSSPYRLLSPRRSSSASPRSRGTLLGFTSSLKCPLPRRPSFTQTVNSTRTGVCRSCGG